jgi:ketosteroid isomerase-like protein
MGACVETAIHTAHHRAHAVAVFVLCFAASGTASADPPADSGAVAGAAPSDAPVTQSKGGLLSSLRQALEEDPKRDVVRGYFDIGTPPDTHRYYCLVNPKTGKFLENGVAGTTYTRSDGMTGIKNPVVSDLNCASAEKSRILVTTGYTLNGSFGGTSAPPAAASKAQAPAPAAAAAAAPVAAAPVAAAPVAAPPLAAAPVVSAPAAVAAPRAAAPVAASGVAGGAVAAASAPVDAAGAEADVMTLYARFIAAQNAHDRAAVAAVLLDSPDFVWGQYRGDSIWGTQDALDECTRQWKGVWKLEPQLKEAHLAHVAPGVAVLVTPLLFTQGVRGQDPVTVPIRWSGVFVKTKAGWRISSVFITPFKDWHTPNG